MAYRTFRFMRLQKKEPVFCGLLPIQRPVSSRVNLRIEFDSDIWRQRTLTNKSDLNLTPSITASRGVVIDVAKAIPARSTAIGIPVGENGLVPKEIGVGRAKLNAAGFEGKVGQTLALPQPDGPVVVAVGIG